MNTQMKQDYDFGPKSFLARYPQLQEAVHDLSNLIRNNPNLAKEILELGMVMAIYAEQNRAARDGELTRITKHLEIPHWPHARYGVDWASKPSQNIRIDGIGVPEENE